MLWMKTFQIWNRKKTMNRNRTTKEIDTVDVLLVPPIAITTEIGRELEIETGNETETETEREGGVDLVLLGTGG